MVPIDKVKDIINKYDALEKELSLGNMDPKLYVKSLKNILASEVLLKLRENILILNVKKRI